MIPKAITPELIRESSAVFQDLCMYVNENRSRIDGSVPADFPAGLVQLALIVNLDNAIRSGGLWGYFGDITDGEGQIDEVDETIAVLQQMRAPRFAAILQEGLEVWKEFLSIYLPARCRVNKKSFEEFQQARQFRDAMEIQLDPLDVEYFESHGDLARIIGEYARTHSDEFVHPPLSEAGSQPSP